MSNGARERAPTRLIYVESSDEENDSVSMGPPRTAPAEAAGTASSLPAALSSSTSQSQSLKRKSSELTPVLSINDALMGKAPKPPVENPHSSSRHYVERILACRPQLLDWYDEVKNLRGMPWRKAYDPDLSAVARNQRAYEVLTSEIMLQQTQVLVLEPCLVWLY